MIDLKFLQENPDLAKSITIEVSGSDLMAFGKFLHDSAMEEASKLLPDGKEEYLTPQQFSDILHISMVTLWTWDKKGITSPLHIGNRKLYRRSDLEKIMTQ
jgi:hypothetical protein